VEHQSVVAREAPPATHTRRGPVEVASELQAERAERTAARSRGSRPGKRPSRVTGASGSALDETTGRQMRHRLGHDFGRVRIFADSSAAAATRALDAHAFAAGENVLFGDGLYSPRTRAGQALLAHELTHVMQQRARGIPQVMRKGRTATGFFANLFQFWDYSKETLQEYLATLRQSGETVGDDDSDDMARQIASEWKMDRSAYDLPPRVRVLLIREMLDGVVLGSDQEGVLTILEGSSNAELKGMIGSAPGQITYGEIHSHFGGRRDRLELFNEQVLSRLDQFKAPPAGGKPLLDMLAEKEAATGLRVEQLSIFFHMSPGALYKSFLADVVVPKGGARVTITITREKLRINVDPGILIDIIGPVNSTLNGVTFRFQGSRAELDVDEFRQTANDKVYEFIQDMLAGTRFAASDYNFSRDPHLLAEIRDPMVIGDLERVKYNLQKSSAGEGRKSKKEEGLTEKALGSIAGAGAALNVVHPKGERFPKEEKGWGVKIPAGTAFLLDVETAGSGAELAEKEVQLSRLGVKSSGIVVVRGTEEILVIEGFDMLPGLKFKLYGLHEKKDLKEVMKEESPGKMSSAAAGAMSTYDSLMDFLNWAGGGNAPKSNVAVSIAKWLGEREMNAQGRYFARLYWSTVRDFTGMTDAQLAKFFGIRAPGGE
jgi:hypothetical protein